jgi:tetratricopeptide (TPR) repeat protein
MSCHPDIYESYVKSEMGRSMSKLDATNIIEDFPQREEVYDSVGNYYYEMIRKGDRFFQHEYRRDKNRKIIHERFMDVDYVMGSGNNLRMYFHDENGMLYELPLTWYVHKKRWDFSPGYREFGNLRFSRYANARCIGCHNSFLEQSATANERYVKPYPMGIGCERCHGPGELHVRQALEKRLGGLPLNPPAIVNPRKLPPQQQLDVCRQCHLQGKAWALHEGSDWFDFRPGMKLESNRSVYFRATSQKEVFEVADSPHRLSLSRCFKESSGTLTCISCHNPHRSITTFSVEYYNEKCIRCHAVESLPGRNVSHPHSGTDNCISCHMNRTGTDNTLHGVTSTDHWIRIDANKTVIDWTTLRKPASEQPLTRLVPDVDAQDESRSIRRGMAYLDYHMNHDRRAAYLDSALTYLSEGLGRTPNDARGYSSLGEVRYALSQGDLARSSYLKALHLSPDYAEVHFKLGRLNTDENNLAEALRSYRQAVWLRPDDPAYLDRLGMALVDAGKLEEGRTTLERVLTFDKQNPYTYSYLGNLYAMQLKQPAKALPYFKELMILEPDFPDGNINLGNTYALLNKYGEAAKCYEMELRARPRSVQSYFNLGRVYTLAGKKKEARAAFEKVLELDPSMTVATTYLNQLRK